MWSYFTFAYLITDSNLSYLDLGSVSTYHVLFYGHSAAVGTAQDLGTTLIHGSSTKICVTE
jgi:hypothetical protein